MQVNRFIGSVGALRRKLRALASVAEDAGATAPEKANAEALKKRLEQRLREAGAPAGDWTDNASRLGRLAKEMRKPASPDAAKGDWTDNAHRLGKAFRRSYKKWLSD
jgi:predicted trehalose synthase